MGTLSIGDRLGDFVLQMAPGTLYWEWDNGKRIAMHKTVYDLAVDDGGSDTYPYRKVIDAMTLDTYTRIRKIFYKTVDGTWINWLRVLQQNPTDPYSYAETYKNLFAISEDLIQSVEYIASDFSTHNIDESDGVNFEGFAMKNFPLKEVTKFRVEPFSIDNPSYGTDLRHLMNDIKITITDADFEGDFNNTLAWIGGIFVPIVHDDVNDRIIYIKNGISYIGTVVQDFMDVGTPVYRPGSWNGTVDLAEEKNVYRYDFEIKIFQWPEGVTISEWIAPSASESDTFLFSDTVLNMTKAVRYTDGLFFDDEINDRAHFIMLNGQVLGKDFYHIDPENPRHIILDGAKHHVHQMLESLVKDREADPLQVTDPATLVNMTSPGSSEYSLINFGAVNAGKQIVMRRSESCIKNFPYPFHVTFSELNLGDLVLMDGIFEKYILHSRNSIRYPMTAYLARFNDYSVLSHTRIERVYFYEEDE